MLCDHMHFQIMIIISRYANLDADLAIMTDLSFIALNTRLNASNNLDELLNH